MKKTSKTKKKTASKKVAAKKPVLKSVKVLQKGEPKSFRTMNEKGKGYCVIVCDHASNRVPKSLGNLGLSKKQLSQHIAWDPGTADIGKQLSKDIDSPVVLAEYSRLVVDLNRGHDNKDCMRDMSDDVFVPRNHKLTPQQKNQRLKEIFWTYHGEIDRQIERMLKKGVVPVLISVHSFTPVMKGFKRPWHIGVMWNKNPGISKRLAANLRRNNPKLNIGENVPYSLKDASIGKDTIERHAGKYKLPYIILEFRQDLVATKKGALKFAKIFHESLWPILADAKTYAKQK